jgi:6-phosphogluconolactonase
MGEWRQALLRPAAIPEEHIFPIADHLPLNQAATAYETQLLTVLRSAAASAAAETGAEGDGSRAASVDVASGRIDAVVLGMGPDGHTASLFPGHPIVDEASCAVAPISDSPKPPPCRITLTLPVLNAARLALFVVTGASKAPAVRSAFEPEPGVPAGMIVATEQTVWCLDAPAAAELLQGEATSAALYG